MKAKLKILGLVFAIIFIIEMCIQIAMSENAEEIFLEWWFLFPILFEVFIWLIHFLVNEIKEI